jgi:2'-hydroxyisoflavone reductase
VEDITGETYGPLKAHCEEAVQAAFPGSNLVIRPGLIVGPHDPTDRFTYWPWRIAQGGEVLAPESPDYRVQFIDARDLADWTLHLIESGQTGIFNATGPANPLTLGALLEECELISQRDAALTWVEPDFLLAREIQPWVDLPLWTPDPDYAGIHFVDVRMAIQHGLEFRPTVLTIEDTLNWARARPPDHAWRAGLDREKERQLLEEWHDRRKEG